MRGPRLVALLVALVTSVPGADDIAAGRFLVAARGLPDPNFAETVVLLTSHSSKGDMGLVINRPTRMTVASLFPENTATKDRRDKAYWGGPVETGAVLVLVRSRTPLEDAQLVVGDIYLVNTKAALDKLLKSPGSIRLYLGYSGWGTGQLAREMQLRSWHVLRADPAMIFDADPDAVWPRLIQRTDVFLAFRGVGR